MALSTPKLLGLTGVVLGSIAIIFIVLLTSAIPQFSVYELFNKNDPSTLLNKKLQLVGDVTILEGNDTLIITDWETRNFTVTIIHTGVPLPAGVAIGKRILVEGVLKASENGWIVEASLISTKCPSKYEA
jgi:hypothetical protein